MGKHPLVDGSPFLFVNGASHECAIVCLSQKVGSTTWKLVFAGGLKAVPTAAVPERLPEPLQAAPGFQAAAASVEVKRFMFVRNPYARLLSGFLEKVVPWSTSGPDYSIGRLQHKYGYESKLTKQNRTQGFASFVHAISRANDDMNAHFRLLTKHCQWRGPARAPRLKVWRENLREDRDLVWCVCPQPCSILIEPRAAAFHVLVCARQASYDYVLPLEQMARWFKPFVASLGLQPVITAGWDTSSPAACCASGPRLSSCAMRKDYCSRVERVHIAC